MAWFTPLAVGNLPKLLILLHHTLSRLYRGAIASTGYLRAYTKNTSRTRQTLCQQILKNYADYSSYRKLSSYHLCYC